MKVGSLFDGISGFLLVARRLGFLPVWASEIEKVPISISRRHFPSVLHLGDITKINGAEIEPVELVCFGSPCQDLSIAGKGEGFGYKCLDCGHKWQYSTTYGVRESCPKCGSENVELSRSGLFNHAIRIIREMRVATNGLYPRYAIWENVPGAFSSNKGEDFRTVLESFGETEIPMPDGGKWAQSGMVEFPDCRVFWRQLDAQYWGVPQRRKRIFLVADFTGQCGPEILFEPEGVRGDIETSGTEREETSGLATQGVESESVLGFVSNASVANNAPVLENKTPTMGRTNDMAVAIDCRNDSVSAVSGTLQAKSNGGQSLNFINPVMIGKVASTLRASAGAPKHEADFKGRLVLQPIAIFDKAQITSKQNASRVDFDLPSPPVVSTGGLHAIKIHPKVSGTICASGAGTNRPAGQGNETDDYQVRRLTPLEWERLQGFPDGWTEFGTNEKGELVKISD